MVVILFNELRNHLKSFLKNFFLTLLISSQQKRSLFHFFDEQFLSFWSVYTFDEELFSVFILINDINIKTHVETLIDYCDNIASLKSWECFKKIWFYLFSSNLSVFPDLIMFSIPLFLLMPSILLLMFPFLALMFPYLVLMLPFFVLMFPFFILMFPFFIFISIIRLFHPLSLVMSANHWMLILFFLSFLIISQNWMLFCLFHPSSLIVISDQWMLFLKIPVIMLTSSNQLLLFAKFLLHSLFHSFSMTFYPFIHILLDLLNLFINILIKEIFHLNFISIDDKLWHKRTKWRKLFNFLFCDLDLNL